MDIKLAYGIRDGQIVHISEIDPANRGEKCNCICPICKGTLLARLGDKRQWHFAHKASCKCDIIEAQQTGLHLLAKEIIRQNNSILVPKLSISFHDVTTSKIDVATAAEINIDLPDIKSSIIQYDSVEIEKPIGDIIADAVISVKGKPIMNGFPEDLYHRIPQITLPQAF